jgi:cbb3-type cytochrome oxidase subunit 3
VKVPEPSMVLLFGAGAAAVFRRRRKGEAKNAA